MIKRKFFLISVFAGVIIGFYTPLFLTVPTAYAGAFCDLSVSVNQNNGYVSIYGSVRETRPGLDPSQSSVEVYTTKNELYDSGSGQESAEASDADVLQNGTYRVTVSGNTRSNPANRASSCSKEQWITVNVDTTKRLDVYKSGTGSGTVSGPGISCGSDCSQSFNSGTSVALTASPSSGSTFAGWSGACSGTGSCNVSMTANKSVTATFNVIPPPSPPGGFSMTSSSCFAWPSPKIEANHQTSSGASYYTLHKRVYGSGSGYSAIYQGSYSQLDSYTDSNISAGNSYEYRVSATNSGGTTWASGSVVEAVSSANCGGPTSYTLSTSVSSGSGTITGTGISCPGDCSESLTVDAWTTLTASPSTGYAFSSWSGACAGQGASCSLYMDSAKSTSANFSTNNYTLSASVSGSGSVNSSPAGISNCTSSCSASYAYNTAVTLTATPNAGQNFSGWSGSCSGTGSCVVTMSTARSVTATFTTNSYGLTVSRAGNGSGSVSSSPGGISCGSDCSESYTYNTSVSLYPSASAGSSFSGWSGDCSGTGACTVSMTTARSVTASFALVPFTYSLSNSGTTNVTKASGNAYGQNVITKSLGAGLTQPVSLSLSGVPSGTSYSISNATCSPTCSSTITFTVGPTTPVGTNTITVTGSPNSAQTSFNLVVTGSPFSVSCAVNPNTTAVLGENVTWSATVVGGVPPLTYSWSGSGIPTSPAPSTNPYTLTYSTIGTKTATLTVRDADSVQSACPPATIEITFDPNFEEF
ncbi:MAG: hypothetical protein NUV78_01530 [Candidatus Zambryskibacteria bacterium]|nr:hypothetical protein [Candidatus Zambryskibacteria bacterium]